MSNHHAYRVMMEESHSADRDFHKAFSKHLQFGGSRPEPHYEEKRDDPTCLPSFPIMSLGLVRGTVRLLPHNEEWHRLFEEEAAGLRSTLGDSVAAIEHIGSTAICSISAKPLLDIMVGIKPFGAELSTVPAIEALGYEYKGENGVPNRHFFGKGVPRVVHLNVVEYGGEFWHSHIAFRDYLRQNSDAAAEYERLKQTLAARFADDRESYTNGKLEFVNRILSLSRP